jgi:hypothetical protein
MSETSKDKLTRPEVAADGDNQLELGGAVNAGKLGRWNIRATGLFAGAIASFLVLAGILVWLKPTSDAQHFELFGFVTFVCGAMVNASMLNGRLSDALREKDNYRREMERIADDKRALEKTIVDRRLSSVPPPPPVPKRKDRRG